MLVLTRRPGEEIVIRLPSGELVRFAVTEINRQNVKIGIEADATNKVWRLEIYNRKYAPLTPMITLVEGNKKS